MSIPKRCAFETRQDAFERIVNFWSGALPQNASVTYMKALREYLLHALASIDERLAEKL